MIGAHVESLGSKLPADYHNRLKKPQLKLLSKSFWLCGFFTIIWKSHPEGLIIEITRRLFHIPTITSAIILKFKNP